MGTIRTRSSDIRKKLQEKREKAKKEREKDRKAKSGRTELANNEMTEDGIDITNWPTRAEAARVSGISRNTLIRLQQTGDIDSRQDSQGVWRFNPDDLDVIAETRSSDAAVIMTETVGTVVKVSQEQTHRAQEHAEAFAGITLEHSEMAWEQMRLMTQEIREENVSLRVRVKELEEERRENLKHIEEAETKAHKRKMEEQSAERLDKRIDWALTTVVAIAGPAVLNKMGLQPGVAPGTIGALMEGKTVDVGDITIEKLEEMNMNALLLIANIDEQRFTLLKAVATPEEVAALTEVRETVARIRAKKAGEDGKGSKTEGA